MEIYSIIKPLGITTVSLLLVTAGSGLLKVKMKTHKIIAGVTVAVALVHGLIVLISG